MSVFTVEELELIAAANAVILEKFKRGMSLTSPDLVAEYLTTKLAVEEQEVFRVLLLDSKHRLIDDVALFKGSIAAAYVHPRDIIKKVLDVNAAAVICAHNHPSGHISPSRADIDITDQIKAALATIDVRLLDHVIVGGGETYSFAGRGILN
ncbi:DNA repair protein RadC (plasmid) [Aeromonas sp. FDAARGOS 1405]|uniref:RadC family protein n=1 Tax=Aeromonas TaxID=642 RepID=UPI001C23BE3F|nr:DNA repair protein RadC [Aeromonas sp. FDAARGOS 1405]QXB31800.1 DNA repair protein RadC [Aeromonas sp. FDAARGOS 1405]